MSERAAGIEELKDRLARLPRARFAHLPTPLDRCPRLGRELGGVDLWVKRDDATGMALGGNKTRQLEFILGHALSHGYDCVIQGAASQSNHARQLAAIGARLGIDVFLTPWLDARSRPVQGNFLLSHLYGAELRPIPSGASSIEAKARLAEELRTEGRKPYVVGMGSHEALVLAAVAYVEAFLEVLEQLGETSPPHWVFTTSQGSTQAGLQVAVELLGLPTKVVGVNPMGPEHEAYASPEAIARIVVDCARLLGYELNVGAEAVVNRTDQVGEGYGLPTRAGLTALRLLARTEGILLDPVYTSKGFAGLVDAVRRSEVRPGERVVFIHTGGLPLLFAYADEVLEAMGGEDAPRS